MVRIRLLEEEGAHVTFPASQTPAIEVLNDIVQNIEVPNDIIQNIEVPNDIIQNILVRLPVKFIIRFKLNRHWGSTISTSRFAEYHLSFSSRLPKSFIMQTFEDLDFVERKRLYMVFCDEIEFKNFYRWLRSLMMVINYQTLRSWGVVMACWL